MLTDPISDMLIRIKNAQERKKEEVEIYPKSKIKLEILKILKREGFIIDYQEKERSVIVKLRYYPDGSPLISNVKRVSKPSRRVYIGYEELKPVVNGLGIAILSTSKGIITDKEARKLKIGGELLLEVW
ncbi:MAG: 30S ribosomal protein S8 [candidate division WOR-3 bacterium]|nr:30S ribosomal protein S8 [candidate division WOR-3 bacterium]MCX7947950.1 30S ribosomal protein S8 [candidate division WOR-3 bacterium]MDW8150894.1 30S ribosomal protein S8 [candidate division WOR-3 bacterium]